MTARRILVTGGIRSGKSRYAESLLAGETRVTYLAPGGPADLATDPEWAARVAAHRARRPVGWSTVETTDVAGALRDHRPPFLLDCLGTWVTAVVDQLSGWDRPDAAWRPAAEARCADLVQAWQSTAGLAVAVTNEVGWGLISEHRSGRIFTDLLGRLNQQVAAASDEVVLVVAGRTLRL